MEEAIDVVGQCASLVEERLESHTFCSCSRREHFAEFGEDHSSLFFFSLVENNISDFNNNSSRFYFVHLVYELGELGS